MMNKMKFSSAALFGVFVLVLLSGCSTPVYDKLQPIPEYQPLAKEFDTSAVIRYIPFRDNQPDSVLAQMPYYLAQLPIDSIVQEHLIKNGYSAILTDANYAKDFSKTVHIVTPIECSFELLSCEDGRYLDIRLIMMVREPGNLWWSELVSEKSRFFQAYARHFLGEEDLSNDVFCDVFRKALANMFTIESFRESLEPHKKASAAVKASPGEILKGFFGTSERHELIRWSFVASEQGDKSADKVLAAYLLSAENICGDNKRLAAVLTRLAENGEVNAQYKLAGLYEQGLGVFTDAAKAFFWYMKAAEQNNAVAQYKVALAYENGDGVAKDLYEAEKWYEKAAKNKHNGAVNRLKELRNVQK